MCVSGPAAPSSASTSETSLCRRRERREAGKRAERLRHAGEAAAREDAQPEPGHLDRLRPARLVALEVGGGEQTAALVGEREQPLGDRPRVRALGAFRRERLERGHEPRLLQKLARAQQRPAGRVDPGAGVERQHRREHLQARACAGGIGTPSRASRSAGSTRRAHGSRPCARQSAPSPAGTPGTAHEAGRRRSGRAPTRTGPRGARAPPPSARPRARARRRSSRGSAPSRSRRRGRSRGRRRAARSSRFRPRRRRDRRRRPHPPRSRPRRGSRRRRPRSPDARRRRPRSRARPAAARPSRRARHPAAERRARCPISSPPAKP